MSTTGTYISYLHFLVFLHRKKQNYSEFQHQLLHTGKACKFTWMVINVSLDLAVSQLRLVLLPYVNKYQASLQLPSEGKQEGN